VNQLAVAKTKTLVAFTYQGVDILFDDDRLISLTNMWRADGSPKEKRPNDWSVIESSKAFIASVTQNLNTAPGGIWKTRRGKHLGGTFAHWQIALAYGKYLSPEFHQCVNQAFKEWSQEKVDPGLKASRAIDAFKKQGKDDAWIGKRLEGLLKRKALTATMADHNTRPVGAENPYAEATRAISLQVLGQTPSEIRAARGVAKRAPTRDHLSEDELDWVRFAESQAARLMRQEAADGNAECVDC